MDERGAHYVAMVVALIIPMFAGMALVRLLAPKHGPPLSRVPMEVVLISSFPPIPEVAPSSTHSPGNARRHRGTPQRQVGPVAAVPRADGSATAGSHGPEDTTLDLSLPDTGDIGFHSSSATLGQAWSPSLPRLRVRMTDSSIGGRLERMQKAAVCRELQMMVDAPAGSHATGGSGRDVAIRELEELGCLR